MKKTTVYFTEDDLGRLEWLKAHSSLPGVTAACRVGLILLEATLMGDDIGHSQNLDQIIDGENVKRKERNMSDAYTIDNEKLEEVVALFNREVDPAATEGLVRAEICADWNEGEEHQEWVDNAPVQEIVKLAGLILRELVYPITEY